jgi:secondary thiamine-phosphate synthase enzyme
MVKITYQTFKHQTKKLFDFLDLTDEIKDFIEKSKIKSGLVNIQLLHTSAALIVNEKEPLLEKDIERTLEGIASHKMEYRHDDFSVRTVNLCDDECQNGHSHCKSIMLLPAVTLNLIDGELQLGQWQRVILVELDHSRPRRVQVQIIGEE